MLETGATRRSWPRVGLLACGLGTLLLGGALVVGCQSTAGPAPGFELDEPSEGGETSAACGDVEVPAGFKRRNPDFEPRVEPACAHSWSPDGKPVWFHTVEESIATRDEWFDAWKGGLVRGEGGKLPVGSKGFEWKASHDANLQDLARRIPGDPESGQPWAGYEPRRGLFWGFGKPYVNGEHTHMFECTPGMPIQRLRKELGNPKYWRGHFTWKVGNGIVTCEPDPQGGHLNIQIMRNEGRPFAEPGALEEMIETAERKSKEAEGVPESELPFDYYPTFKRFYYLEPPGRYWETTRIIKSTKTCYNPPPHRTCAYSRPAERVHWKFDTSERDP